jgi:calpain-15
MKGFCDFFRDQIATYGEDVALKWFEMLGYDRDLHSIRSRCFLLTIHSDQELSAVVRDAIQTDLDHRANLWYVSQYGEEIKLEQ